MLGNKIVISLLCLLLAYPLATQATSSGGVSQFAQAIRLAESIDSADLVAAAAHVQQARSEGTVTVEEAAGSLLDLTERLVVAQDYESARKILGQAVEASQNAFSRSALDRSQLLRRAAELSERLRDHALSTTLLNEAISLEAASLGKDNPALRFAKSELSSVLRKSNLSSEAGALDQDIKRLAQLDGSAKILDEVMGGDPATRQIDAKHPNYDLIRVFYATNRARNESQDPNALFSGKRAQTNFGNVLVSIPHDRVLGQLRRASMLRLEFVADPAKHVILRAARSYSDQAAFTAAVRQQLLPSSRKEVLIFVHGYNQSFRDGIETTAQLAGDLQIDGAPVLYSWPSKASPLSYIADSNEADVDDHVRALADLIKSLASQTGAGRVNVIAHSMGSRLLLKASERLARELPNKNSKRLINEMIYASPDVDAQDFVSRSSSSAAISDRVTVYSSTQDRALLLSAMANDFKRAGDASIVWNAPGVERIDTSAVSAGFTGHGDFAISATDDLRGLIWGQLGAGKRCTVARSPSWGGWLVGEAPSCRFREFGIAMWLIRKNGSVVRAISDTDAAISFISDMPVKVDSETSLKNLESYRAARLILSRLQ